MIYKACAELGVWPLSRVVKVDDAEAGIAEGKAAGVFTVGSRPAMRSVFRLRLCRRCQRPSAPTGLPPPARHYATREPTLSLTLSRLLIPELERVAIALRDREERKRTP